MARTVIMQHPLIQHKIGMIRRTETGSRDFRHMISEVAMLMCYEATRDLKLVDVDIETPICPTTVKELEGKTCRGAHFKGGTWHGGGNADHDSGSQSGSYRPVSE